MGTINFKSGSTFTIVSDTPSSVPVDTAGTWNTGYDVDFSAQATQAIATDTTYVIDGKTWTKQNSTNDQTSMALTNGAGLVIIPKAGGADYDAGTRTVPLLSLPLSSAIPGFDIYNMAVRLWVYTSATNYAANYDGALFVLDSGSTDMYYLGANGYNTSGQGAYQCIAVSGANTSGYGIHVVNVTDNVHCIEAVHGLLGCHLRTYSGTYSSGWPTIASMHKHITTRINGNLSMQVAEAATWNATLSAKRNASATALSVTFARMKIEYRSL